MTLLVLIGLLTGCERAHSLERRGVGLGDTTLFGAAPAYRTVGWSDCSRCEGSIVGTEPPAFSIKLPDGRAEDRLAGIKLHANHEPPHLRIGATPRDAGSSPCRRREMRSYLFGPPERERSQRTQLQFD